MTGQETNGGQEKPHDLSLHNSTPEFAVKKPWRPQNPGQSNGGVTTNSFQGVNVHGNQRASAHAKQGGGGTRGRLQRTQVYFFSFGRLSRPSSRFVTGQGNHVLHMRTQMIPHGSFGPGNSNGGRNGGRHGRVGVTRNTIHPNPLPGEDGPLELRRRKEGRNARRLALALSPPGFNYTR